MTADKKSKKKALMTIEELSKMADRNPVRRANKSTPTGGKSFSKEYREVSKELVRPQPRNGGPRSKDTRSKKAQRLQKISAKMAGPGDLRDARITPTGYDVNALYRQLKLMSHPFTSTPSKSVVNFNPVPSLITSLARTDSQFSFSINANTAATIYLWGGHGPIDPTATMDGVSYHGGYLTLTGGLVRVVGPVTTSSTKGICMAYKTGTTIDELVAVSTMTPIDYAVQLPYTAVTDNGGHTRWKLLSTGLKIIPSSANVQRAGTITSCQLSSKVSFAAATPTATLSVFPTYRIHEEGTLDSEFNISWVPRIDDLSFWHSKLEAASDAEAAAGVGMIVQINNPTSNSLSYNFQAIHHWEMAGSNLIQLGGPNLELPGVKEPIVSGLAKISNGAGYDASSVVSHVKDAVAVASTLFSAFRGVAKASA